MDFLQFSRGLRKEVAVVLVVAIAILLLYVHPTNIGAARATPTATPLVVMSDWGGEGSKFGAPTRFFFLAIFEHLALLWDNPSLNAR